MSHDAEPSATIAVRLVPRARADEIAGRRGDALLVRVTAPPVDGRANEALCRLLARRLGVAAGRVSVVRGRGARDKLVRVEGLTDAEVGAALGA
jgi:uncharacterized protein (TIGR00251 family)